MKDKNKKGVGNQSSPDKQKDLQKCVKEVRTWDGLTRYHSSYK